MAKAKRIKIGAEVQCNNHCPQCNASIDGGNIDIETGEFDESPHQRFTCNECGCVFEEIYRYAGTQKVGQNPVG